MPDYSIPRKPTPYYKEQPPAWRKIAILLAIVSAFLYAFKTLGMW